MNRFTRFLIASVAAIAVAAEESDRTRFSGVYNPTCKQGLEVFAGAWLMHTTRFSKPEILEAINRISFIEAHTFFVALGDGRSIPSEATCEGMTKHVVMTRDYFDFFVEHLSSTLNIAEELDSISGLLLNRSVHKAVHLKDVALIRHPKIRIFDDVVAIIPFAMTSGLMHSASGFENQQLRLMFFEQTFWSIYRYFPCIAISVTRKRDYDGLMSLNLPFFHVFADFDQEEKQPVQFNVKMGLKHMHEMLTQNSTWRSRFRFVYFSEGDSILHMRSSKSLYDAMSAPALRGELILTPHRMQTMPMPKNIPEKSASIPRWKREAMKNAEIITEDAVSTVGSCCDDGRMIFKSCGNHWYNCQESGIADIKTWMRFGKNGFTMSLTEHKGRCQYTPDRQVCALPPDCTRENSDFPQDFKSICREVASVWSSDPAVPSQQFDRSSQISIQNAKKPISLGLNNGPKLTNLMHSAMKKAAQSAR